MRGVLSELHYLPSIAFFSAASQAEEIVIEKHEYFQKQTFRNRCQILTPQGIQNLIVPLTAKHGKVLITDVRIDYQQKWVNNHWRAIQSAYGKAPFFEYYADGLEKVLYKRFDFLYDLNRELLSLCLKWLRWSTHVRESLSYEAQVEESLQDIRSLINPKKTDILEDFFNPSPYVQVFGNDFVSNLSLIDLIFCEGPEATKRIQASVRN
jgi:hypothetical protein